MSALRAAALALCALAAGGCVIDPYDDPLPGGDAVIVLKPGATSARAGWPVAYRRGARFVVENRTGKPIETLVLDLSRCKKPPRELIEVVVEEPAGAPAKIMFAPHGTWALRAQIGKAGSVLAADGAKVSVVLRVLGEPGAADVEVIVPGTGDRL